MRKVNLSNVLYIINANLHDVVITEEQINDTLTKYGMDSVSFIQIIVALEEEFECEFPDSKLLITEMDTVEKIWVVLKDLYDKSK